jgi:hypothetical protein
VGGVQLHSGSPEARKRKAWLWNVDSHVRGSSTIDRMLTSPCWSAALLKPVLNIQGARRPGLSRGSGHSCHVLNIT